MCSSDDLAASAADALSVVAAIDHLHQKAKANVGDSSRRLLGYHLDDEAPPSFVRGLLMSARMG